MAIPDTLKPTVGDFITTYGTEEASQLSTLEDPLTESYLPQKIEAAIDDAFCLVEGYDARVNNICAKFAIRKRIRRTVLIIARYYMDNLRPSNTVTTRYEHEIEYLEKIVCECDTMYCNLSEQDKIDTGLDQMSFARPTNVDSECRVYTRERSLRTWRRDQRWRNYNLNNEDDRNRY